ncbi:hypothetical protein PCANC_27398 [Puccinia coronata f. sp. avenae]|uniref:Short-chain dehydrogenase/reductase 3 n=1 Tax=Puccinia coronata f. sp. avenae TaxID=200324 RepID=A0A2N5RYG0_9BASI|nr:hypothetical protein PCANC_27398 [Puccinia coronata f. sp. avenae]
MHSAEIKQTLQSINIDLLYSVFERTFLSPFFSCWIPLIAIGQSAPRFYYWSARFLCFVLLRTLLCWSSQAWRNRRWTRGQIDWSEQVVLVTGGSEGLGRVFVETLLLKHITVVVLDINPYSDQDRTEEGDVHFYQCDISDPLAVEAAATRIRSEVGSPTIIVNNAGIVHGKPILELEPNDIQKTFGVNVFAHFYIYKAFLPEMIKKNSGHIVTIASILGHVGVAGVADYCGSKAAAILLHQSLKEELKATYQAHGIRTTLVCPGLMTTKMFENGEQSFLTRESFLNLKTNKKLTRLSPGSSSLQSNQINPVTTWNEFLFPKISPHELMKKIIQAIDNEDSAEIYLPLYTKFNFLFNLSDFFLFPSWLLSFLHWFVGSNQAYGSSPPTTKKTL